MQNNVISSISKIKRTRPNIRMLLAIASGALMLMWYNNIQAMHSIQEHLIEGNKPDRNRLRIDNTSFSSKKRKEHDPIINNSIYNGLVKVADFQLAREKSYYEEGRDAISHSSPNTNKTEFVSPYAYAWVIGGIHEDRLAYKGFMWTIFISAHLLKKLGTTADFWVYVRLSPDSILDDLPPEDRKVLEALGFNIVLLEKPKKESFAQLVYDKFLTINMTDYKRVMFLDADMIPLTGLDFYFHLSDPEYTEVPTLLKSG
jgi:hypothetical protein